MSFVTIFSIPCPHSPRGSFANTVSCLSIKFLNSSRGRKYIEKLLKNIIELDIEQYSLHRAIDDTKALYYVTLEMKKERNDLAEYINIFGYNPKYGVGGIRFPFIEYKPQRFRYRMAEPDEILPRIKLKDKANRDFPF
mgnify:CR=1 FL=1